MILAMGRSLLLLLALPMTANAWRWSTHLGAAKRPRPAWTSSLREGVSGDRVRARMSASSGEDDSGAGSGFADASGKEWKDDGRDSLPFVVYDAAPPPRKVGVANLPPLTGTGDTLWHGAKHYKVLRVSSHYKYEGGRFVVRRKSIEAKELKRVAKERVVARLVYGDGGNRRQPPLPPTPRPSC